MFAFCAKPRDKAKINENIESLNFSVLYGKLQLPPQIPLFFQYSYYDQFFCRLTIGWTSMFAFCVKNREKANINENIQTCTENFSLLFGKLYFPPQI